MRSLILSDIHGNRQGLEAVLDHAADRYDAISCCGDLVGYGADPNYVADWVRRCTASVVRGNHDKACVGGEEIEWFNPAARASALWTQSVLTAENTEYLRHLPAGPRPSGDGFQILHGSPLDEDEYLLTPAEVAEVAAYLPGEVNFFGHTHVQCAFLCHRNGVKGLRAIVPPDDEHVLELERDTRYLLNPGSVGQPRDGDPRAAYCVYDSDLRLVSFYRVAYDIGGAQQRILGEGLPEVLARRLSLGK